MSRKGLREGLEIKLFKLLGMLAIVGVMLLLPIQSVLANETEVVEGVSVLDVVKAKGQVEAKAEPDESSETVMTFEDGAMIAVVSDSDAIWYTIGYQGNTYYVKKADTELVPDSPFHQQNDDLDAEFEENYIESKILIEEIDRLQKEARSTRIWAVVIIILVVAIIGINAYLMMKGKKEKEEEEGDNPTNS